MSKILIIEDEKEIAQLEKDYLELEQIKVDILYDANGVVDYILKNDYDLILLDMMLPNGNGIDILKDIRQKIDIPILMVTAKSKPIDKIKGLSFGADDYIVKPFDPAELVARVKAHLNQYQRLKRNLDDDEVITIDNIKIYPQNWKVLKDDEEIKFKKREFELLLFLANNPNQVFSKEKLFETIWRYDYVGDVATVTVHINRIREKIEKNPQNPEIIETVWGAGYKLKKGN